MPELRFSEFKDEWEEKSLDELLCFKNGINAPKEDYGDGIKFINVLDILNNDYIIYDKIIDSVKVTEDQFKNYCVGYGDVLFQRSSETREEVGTSNVYLDKEKKCVFGGFVIRGEKIGEYEPFFLKELLKSSIVRKEITSRGGGSTRYNIGQESLKKVKIKLPSLDEQKKIASFLTKIDSKTQKLERKYELWQDYKKGMLQQLFSQNLRFKAGDGSDFPDWEIKFLGEISDIKTGNKDLKDKIDKGKYPFFVRSDNIERINSYSFDGEAILIPGDGKIGEVYHYINGKFDYHQRVYKISDFQEKINGKYIYYYLRRHFLRQALKNSVKATVDSLRLPTIKGMEIKLPTLEEQTKIAQFLTSIDKKIESIQKELQLNKEFKKGLLQKMFPTDKKSKEIKTPDLLDKQTEQTALL